MSVNPVGALLRRCLHLSWLLRRHLVFCDRSTPRRAAPSDLGTQLYDVEAISRFPANGVVRNLTQRLALPP
jgi:hypothetical protein